MRKYLVLFSLAVGTVAHASPAVDLVAPVFTGPKIVYAQEQPAAEPSPAASPAAEVVVKAASLEDQEAPKWMFQILEFAESLPVVGHYLSLILGWAAVISGVFTALAAFFDALAFVLAGVAGLAGFARVAAFVKEWHGKVAPYLKWLSMYNVQKKQKAQLAQVK